MPCNDITDSLKILISNDDRVIKYALRKKTCQGEVGRKSLINKWLKSKNINEITSCSIDDFADAHPSKSTTWEYLYLKHFLAVQAGLSALVGLQSGGVKDYVKIASVEQTPEGTLLEADISVNGLTEEIKACGRCEGCTPQ
jgi:hypothetical protein